MVEYYREGALVNQETPELRSQSEIISSTPAGLDDTVFLGGYTPPERSDVGIAFSKGLRLLSGSGEVTLKGFTGEFLKQLGLEEAGSRWINDAYQSGILMGMDVNELDEQLKGPKNLGEIEDWKGAIAWGMNAVSEQIPNLVSTFAPAVVGTLVFKRPTIGTVGTLGTIDFLNTAEVYTDLLMETGESRASVAAGTGAMMSLLDMIVPMKIIGRMNKGPEFASWFGSQIKKPRSGVPEKIGRAIALGVQEGTTEYVQTMFEGMALNYVQEKDLLTEYSEAQREEQLEAGARGALIGTLLGIPVSYSGRSARKKAKDYAQNIVDKTRNENSFEQSNLEERNPDLQNFSLFGVDGLEMPDSPQNAVQTASVGPIQPTGRIDVLPSPIFKQGLSDEEFGVFMMTGDVSQETIENIAYDVANNYELTEQEQLIYSNPAVRQKVLDTIAEKEDARKRDIFAKQYLAKLKKKTIDGILERDLVDITAQVVDPMGPPPEMTGPPADKARVLSQRYLERIVREAEQAAAERRAITERGLKAVPVGQRRLKVVGLPAVEDVSQSEAENAGYAVSGRTAVLTSKGKPSVSRGKAEQTQVYENEYVVIKKADSKGLDKTTLESKTTTKNSPWVVLDKANGRIIKSVPPGRQGQGTEVDKNGNPIRPENFPISKEFYAGGEGGYTNIQMLLAEQAVETTPTKKEDTPDSKSRAIEQDLSKAGAVPIKEGDIVRRYDVKKDEFVDDIEFTVISVTPVRRRRTTKGARIVEDGIKYKIKPYGDKTLAGIGTEGEVTSFPNDDFKLVISRSIAEVQPERVDVITTEEQFFSLKPEESTVTDEERKQVATGEDERIEKTVSVDKEGKETTTTRLKIAEGVSVPVLDPTEGILSEEEQLRAGVKKPERKDIKRLGATSPSIIKFDPSTGDRPSPETHRVRLTPQAAKKHGLDPSFSYDWEPFSFPQWGEQSDDYIKVAGQLVRHQGRRVRKSVEGQPNITEILKPEIASVRKRPSGIKVDKDDFVKIDPSFLPDNVPDKSTIERAFIDQRTGLFVAHRKKETDKAEESPAYDSIDVEVYLTYNTKKEYQSKIEAMRDFFNEYERSEAPSDISVADEFRADKGKSPDEVSAAKTVPALVRKATPKTVVLKQPRYIRGGDKTTNIPVSKVVSEMETPGSQVKVKVTPLVANKINRERKSEGLDPIDADSFITASEYPLREGLITISSDGIQRQISLNSVLEATVTRSTPDPLGMLNYHEVLLERRPESREAMLIASFKVSNAQATTSPSGAFKFENSYDKFLEELYSDTAHRHGMFGTAKEAVMKRREETFNKNKGQSVILHMYGGTEITGVIGEVNNKTLRLLSPNKSQSILVDITNIEAFDVKKKIGIAKQGYIRDPKPKGDLFIYLPQNVNEDVKSQDKPILSGVKEDVKVFKIRNQDAYRIVVNDLVEQDNLTIDETIDALNQMEKDTDSNLNVVKLPADINVENVDRSYLGKLINKRDKFKKPVPENVNYVYTKKQRPDRPIGALKNATKKQIGEQLNKNAKTNVEAVKKAIEDANKELEARQVAKRNSQVATNTTKTFEEVSGTPFIDLPPNQKFRDKNGGLWRVMDTVGKKNTSVQFLGGPTPDITFQVTWEGKKSEGKLEPNFVVTVRGSSTPSSMEIKTDSGRFANYSIVRPVPADGRGSIKYNTGLTPKRFQEILGPKIGRLNITRLVNKGLIKIVQNQQDVKNPPSDLAVKAMTRNGELVFITNNIKPEEVLPVFVHEVGVHIGLKEVYGSEFANLIEEVKSRKNEKEWSSAFSDAEIVADQFTFNDPIARENFVAEEALAYYVESNNNFKDSFWQRFLDMVSRWVARVKMWFNGSLSNDELIAFARGAVAGMSERNFENAINVIDQDYYSSAEASFDNINEVVNKLGMKYDGATRQEYVSKARTLWDKTKVFFDSLAMLPFSREFRKIRSLLQGKLGAIEEYANDVLKAFDNLSATENQELFDYFTTKDASEDMISRTDLREASVALKKKIMEIADEGVLRGIYPEASQEQMNELRGAYLPRVFLYHILKDGGTRGAGQRKASRRDYANLRMEDMEADLREMLGEVKDVRYLLYRAVTIPQQDIAIIDFLDQVSARQAFKETPESQAINDKIDALTIERQQEGATQEDRDRLKKEIDDLRKEQKELSKEGKRFVSGDIPWIMPNQWVRIKMETEDGVKIINTTLASINRQIRDWRNYEKNAASITEKAREQILQRIVTLEQARKEFLDSVDVDSKLDPNLESDREEIESQISKYYDDNYDISLFKKMPNDADRYGSMANLYVRREIYDDILGNSDMVTGEQNLFQRMLLPYGKHAQLVSIFKTMKVPLNPPTVVRNFVANLVMMQLFGGVSFRRQPALLMETLREMRGQEKGQVFTHSETGKKFTAYELAMEQGIGATTLTNAELRKLEKVFKFMEKDGVWGIVTKGQGLWNKISDFGSNLYQGIETLGKVAVISDMLQNQRAELQRILDESQSDTLTIEDIAVQEANRVLFDYSEVHPTVRGLRSSFLGAPFITYQVKVLPQLAKIISNPNKWHRFLPYVMMIGSMQALFGSLPFMEDDWDKMEELLPEWTKDNTMVFLPWRDSNGKWQAVDLSYFFPWTWYMQTGSNLMKGELAKAAVEGGVVGPGFQLVTTFLTGKDPWSGYRIVNENDPLSDRMFDYMSYANSMIMPPWLTRNGLVSVSSMAEAMGRLDLSELEGKLPDLLLDRKNRYGEPRRSAMGVIGSMVGLTSYAVSPDARSIQNKRSRSEERGLKGDIASTKKDRRLSKKEKERKVNELKRRIDEVRQERAEFNKKTSGIERAL